MALILDIPIMDMIVDPADIRKRFYRCLSTIYLDKLESEKNQTPCQSNIYPFPVHHIRCAYIKKKKDHEISIWFELIDGSIWDDKGMIEKKPTMESFDF